MSKLYADSRNLMTISSQKYERLEKQLLNSIVDFWKKEVIPELSGIDTPVELSTTINRINQKMFQELNQRVETHIKDMLREGLVEGSRRTRIPQSVINDTYDKIMQESNIRQGIQRLTNRLNDRLLTIPNLIDKLESNQLVNAMKSIAYRELQKYETVARTDAQFVVNQARIIEWERIDPEERRLYRWGRGHDSRVTECCIEIDSTVKEEAKQYNGRGVPLSRLIEIVRFVGNKYFPDFRQRELNPHWNCRSGPEYAGLRRVSRA